MVLGPPSTHLVLGLADVRADEVPRGALDAVPRGDDPQRVEHPAQHPRHRRLARPWPYNEFKGEVGMIYS